MPSKFTEHFGLNLWDASDRVHHDDFNEDNRKIDAALDTLSTGLAGKAGNWEYIGQYLKLALVSSFGIDFSRDITVNWDEWEQVVLLLDTASSTFAESERIRFTCSPRNGLPELYAKLNAGSALVLYNPRHNSANAISGFVLGSGLVYFTASLTYDKLGDFYFTMDSGSSNYFQNSVIRLYGRK